MKTRLGSLFLILLLASGALAGVPLHSANENHCGMQEMMDMDCCKKAQQQELTPEVVNAKLCCVLNCSQNETTPPSGSVRIAPPLLIASPSHPAIASKLPTRTVLVPELDSLHGPPGLPPVYLRTVTFLI
jgi:hypothetical protein